MSFFVVSYLSTVQINPFRPEQRIVERNRKAGQNPPRTVASIEEGGGGHTATEGQLRALFFAYQQTYRVKIFIRSALVWEIEKLFSFRPDPDPNPLSAALATWYATLR